MDQSRRLRGVVCDVGWCNERNLLMLSWQVTGTPQQVGWLGQAGRSSPGHTVSQSLRDRGHDNIAPPLHHALQPPGHCDQHQRGGGREEAGHLRD